MRTVFSSVFIVLVSSLIAIAQAPAQTATERVDALLSAMGGRDAWARARFVHVQAMHRDPALGVYENRIWNDFSEPRVRIEALIGGDRVMRGIERGAGWRVRRGVESPLTEAQVESDRAWSEANVYRTLHRLAVNDPALTARAAGEHRLKIDLALGHERRRDFPVRDQPRRGQRKRSGGRVVRTALSRASICVRRRARVGYSGDWSS